jgi:hypothetical protein
MARGWIKLARQNGVARPDDDDRIDGGGVERTATT